MMPKKIVARAPLSLIVKNVHLQQLKQMMCKWIM